MVNIPPVVPTPQQDPFSGQLIIQIYRGAYRGNASSQLQKDLDTIDFLDLKNVCFHGFPRELLANWSRLAGYAKERELSALASWGLDGTKDNDNTILTSAEKGECLGNVLKQDSCKAGLLDAEGRWDLGGINRDGCTEVGALELGYRLRELAPNALVGDQPWPWIDYHGSVRRSARPLNAGGTFAGFPVDEFATVTNWGRFRQNYWLNWKSPSAYWTVTDTMEKQWQPVQTTLQPLGLARPLRVTLQGYGHNAKPWQFVHALLRWMVCEQQPVVLWCAPFPNRLHLQAIMFVQCLVANGFAGPGIDPRVAVKNWQLDYNKNVPENKKITVDGWGGAECISKMGMPFETDQR